MKTHGYTRSVAILVFALTSCASPSTPSATPPIDIESSVTTSAQVANPTPTSSPDAVTIAAQGLISHMPLFIADAEGYFAEQNITVEFIPIESGVELLPLLVANDIDVIAGALNLGLVNVMAEVDNVRIVADKGYNAPDGCVANAIMARSELLTNGEFTSPETVRGATILSNPVGVSGYVVSRWLEDAFGLSIDDVQVERLPRAAQIDALNNGAAILVSASEPNITQFQELAGVETIIDFSEYLPEMNYAFIAFGQHLLIDDPNLGERFMVAYLKGVRQYMQGPTPRNIELISGFTSLEPEFLERVCFTAIREDGRINYAAILPYLEWEYEAGNIVAINTEEQMWDSRFVEYANEILGEP